ncbi:MAG: hypothetical protein AAF558_06265 [Verrucomicrobiota bacterium]
MIEGWQNDDYYILFDDQHESIEMTDRYSFSDYLPGHIVTGLIGWDDFITRSDNSYFRVPTIPLVPEYLESYEFKIDLANFEDDPKVRGKIKWYVKPLIFGGDPEEDENTTWIDLDSHVDAVKYWNNMYKDLKSNKSV